MIFILDISPCLIYDYPYSGGYHHLRSFDINDYNGVYLQQNALLINNRPIYQKIVLVGYETFVDKCIWWDTSGHWYLGLCDDIGTAKAYSISKSFYILFVYISTSHISQICLFVTIL